MMFTSLGIASIVLLMALQQPAAETSDVREAAREAEQALITLREGLRPVLDTGGTVAPEQLRADLERVRAQLNSTLAGPNLAALRAYIDMEFPEIEVRSDGATNFPLAAAVIDGILAAAANLVKKLRSTPSLSIDLTAKTTPPGATLSFAPAGGGQRTETETPWTIRNVYRGLYKYEVHKGGYKTLSGFLNLVDIEFGEMECTLPLVNSSDRPTPCRVR